MPEFLDVLVEVTLAVPVDVTELKVKVPELSLVPPVTSSFSPVVVVVQ